MTTSDPRAPAPMAVSEGDMRDQPDPTLAALGAIEREYERGYPGRWEAVLAGEAAAAEVAAERAGVDPPEEHAVFQDMFSRPADEAAIAALVERAAQVVGEGQGGPVAAPAPSAGRDAGASAAREDAKVVPLRRRAPAIVGALLALAAAVALWRWTAPAAFAPGGYALTLRDAAVSELRSSDAAAEARRYRVDSQIDWVLSPEAQDPAGLELRVLARDPQGGARLVTPVLTRSAAGTLRIRGRLAEVLPLPPGTWRLTFVAGPEGAAPTTPEQAAAAPTIGRALTVEIAE